MIKRRQFQGRGRFLIQQRGQQAVTWQYLTGVRQGVIDHPHHYFTIYDFVKAYQYFSGSEWDGSRRTSAAQFLESLYGTLPRSWSPRSCHRNSSLNIAPLRMLLQTWSVRSRSGACL